jgi:hypothetical protein
LNKTMSQFGQEFYINSRECSGTPSQFQVTRQLFRRPDTLYNVCLTQVVIPNLIPTIRSGQNDTFQYELVVSNVTFTGTVSIQEGYYAPSQLASALQTGLQAIDAQFQVAWDATTSKFLLATGAGKSIRFPIRLPASREQPYYSPEEVFLETVGWKDWSISAQLGDGQFKSASAARIGGSFTIDMLCNFNTDGISTNGRSRMLARIPVNADYGNVIVWEPQLTDTGMVQVEAQLLNNFAATLLDEWGNILKLPNNAHVSIKFKLTLT